VDKSHIPEGTGGAEFLGESNRRQASAGHLAEVTDQHYGLARAIRRNVTTDGRRCTTRARHAASVGERAKEPSLGDFRELPR
jgi:hypothetical protein